MSSFASHAAPSPEHAILKKDVKELQACLDRGWNPEGGEGPDGRPTYPLVDRIIVQGWLEGWQLMRRQWPHLLLEIDLVKRVFSRLQASILRDMLEEEAFTVDQSLIGGKTAMEMGIEVLRFSYEIPPGEESNAVPFDQRAVDFFMLLVEKGADAYAPSPGQFHPEDVECSGHSAWTRALFSMRWTLGMHLMPTRLEDVLRQPRLYMALKQLIEESRNRYHPSRKMAQIVYALWIERFGAWWFKQAGVIPPQAPSEWGFIVGLPLASRQVVWQSWGLLQDDDMNVFHALAHEAKTKDVLPVLRQLLADQGEPEGWLQSSVEGIRPCDLWALVLDGVIPEQPWTLAQALENTRKRGNGLLSRPTR
jgi:hypothetical protein